MGSEKRVSSSRLVLHAKRFDAKLLINSKGRWRSELKSPENAASDSQATDSWSSYKDAQRRGAGLSKRSGSGRDSREMAESGLHVEGACLPMRATQRRAEREMRRRRRA